MTRSAAWPTTMTTRSSGSSASASTTCSTIGRPHSSCRTFGVPDRMREPSPAASTIGGERSVLTHLCLYRSAWASTARWWLGGEGSNLDIGLQRTSCCRYTTPDLATLPTPRPVDGRLPRGARCVASRVRGRVSSLRSRAWTSYRLPIIAFAAFLGYCVHIWMWSGLETPRGRFRPKPWQIALLALEVPAWVRHRHPPCDRRARGRVGCDLGHDVRSAERTSAAHESARYLNSFQKTAPTLR